MYEHEPPIPDPEQAPSTNPVEATLDAVRERLPPVVEAGGRAIEQVAQRAPGAIDSTIAAVDESSSTMLALVGGVSAGLSVGLLMTRAPRVLGLLLAGVALILVGTLLGRRQGDLLGWDR
jgi:hypothetical protein